jgi:CRISPR-associated exonuclease Cas4
MKKIDDFDRIPISALKQFVYCQRRYALMYIECEWGSNYKIVEGDLLHEIVDDPFFNEKKGSIQISRSVPVFSESLNLYGVVDAVEFIKDDNGVSVNGKVGTWRINPIEYKNGKPESSKADNYQLCAQTMCLEEMFNINIPSGDIYYGKIKRRVKIDFTEELRSDVKNQLRKMSEVLITQLIPQKLENQNCNLCSLTNVCLPEISTKNSKFSKAIVNLVRRN